MIGNLSQYGRDGQRGDGPFCGQMSHGQYKEMITSARNAWKNNYHTGRSQNTSNHRVRRNITPKHGSTKPLLELICSYKIMPTVYPPPKRRPFQGRCCSCLPASKNRYFTDDIPDRGIENVLQVKTQYSSNWLKRTFDQFSHIMALGFSYKYPDVSKDVLTSPRMAEVVNKMALESVETRNTSEIEREKKRLEGRVKRLINRMKAIMSNKLLRFTAWFLHKLLSRLLSGILVDSGQLEMVKRACQRDIPVLFLPSHRSHLDYILITFILVNHDLMAPHVAAGDNLLIPVFGALMRHLGGYFIRRKLDKSGKKDYVYRAVLQTYMEELLKRNQNFEFFIEGGRTRSGKATYPKAGLLSVIVDAFNEDIVPDVYIVPVGISYDRLMDGNFCREQMGQPKICETFWRACVAIWKVIMSQYGFVRVDFGQPFSLKEYVKESQKFPDSDVNHLQYESSPDSESPTTPNCTMKVIASETSLYGTDVVSESQRKLVQGLAEHIVYACVSNQALMCTQLVAVLLLNRHREGVSINVLVEDFDWLKDEIRSHGRDLGFCGKTRDVVSQALMLLGNRLVKQHSSLKNRSLTDVTTDNNNEEDNIFIEPTTSLPDIFELYYYANVSNSVFVLESAIANALYPLVPYEKWQGFYPEETTVISQHKLLDEAAKVCMYLRYEYIFSPPCKPIDLVLVDAFERFTAAEILQIQEHEPSYTNIREERFAQQLARSLSCRDDNDYEDDDDDDYNGGESCVNFEQEWDDEDRLYMVNLTDDSCMSKLNFYRAVLAPLLETYYITACHLVLLIDNDLPEDDFTRHVHKHLKERVSTGAASYAESASLDTLKNAVRSFQHHKVINCYQVANLRMLELHHRYQQKCDLNKLIDTFEAYRL